MYSIIRILTIDTLERGEFVRFADESQQSVTNAMTKTIELVPSFKRVLTYKTRNTRAGETIVKRERHKNIPNTRVDLIGLPIGVVVCDAPKHTLATIALIPCGVLKPI